MEKGKERVKYIVFFLPSRINVVIFYSMMTLFFYPGSSKAGSFSFSKAVDQLIHDANYWEERGNFQAAIIDLKRALKEDPSNKDILLDLGIILSEEGNEKEARALLLRLHKLYPGSIRSKTLQMAINKGKIDSGILSRARKEVQSHHYDKGIILYKLAYHGIPLNDFQALEYYQTLSAIPGKRNEALKNLGKIQKKHPNNKRIQLVVAEVLIDRENTRRNGLRILSTLALSKSQSISKKVLSDWRTALLWLHAEPSDKILYESYLNFQPLDKDIRRKLAGIPVRAELAEGYRFLKKNNLRKALKHFEKAMEDNPMDGDVAGAIGIVRLRQRRYEEAISVFRWALSHQGDRYSFLKPFQIAQTQYLLEKGRHFLFLGNLEKAKDQFEKVIQMEPMNSEVYFEIATINHDEKNYSRSIQFDKKSLEIDPYYFPPAVDLITTLIHENKLSLAHKEMVKYGPIIPHQTKQRINAHFLRKIGQKNLNSRDLIDAYNEFSMASTLMPNDPWIRFGLAETLLEEGHPRLSIATMSNFLKIYPDSENGWFASALVYEKIGEFKKARISLAHIPYEKWTKPMRSFSARLSAEWFDRRAQLLAKRGHYKTAQKLKILSYLIQGKKDVGRNFSLNLALARLSVKAGNNTDAMDRYGSLIEQNPGLWFLFREAFGNAIASNNVIWVDSLKNTGLLHFSYIPEFYELLGDWSEKENHWKKALKNYLIANFLNRKTQNADKMLDAKIQKKIRNVRAILIAKEGSKPYIEILGGETILSQGSQFYMGEIGGFIPFGQKLDDRSLLNSPLVQLGFRWLVMGNFLHYPILSAPSPLSSSVNQVSLNGVNAAVGIRGSFRNAFLDLLLGPSWGISAQTQNPFKNELNIYGQIEYGLNTRLGFLDLYGNYVGILQYLYGQARFLSPLSNFVNEKGFMNKTSIGPEVIFQGNNTYNDGQIGAAVQFPLWFSNASLLIDGGFLRSSVSVGYGGYEGTYVDIRF